MKSVLFFHVSQKERDLELAARIGQSLLKKNKSLTERNEFLEEQVEHIREEVRFSECCICTDGENLLSGFILSIVSFAECPVRSGSVHWFYGMYPSRKGIKTVI